MSITIFLWEFLESNEESHRWHEVGLFEYVSESLIENPLYNPHLTITSSLFSLTFLMI